MERGSLAIVVRAFLTGSLTFTPATAPNIAAAMSISYGSRTSTGSVFLRRWPKMRCAQTCFKLSGNIGN